MTIGVVLCFAGVVGFVVGGIALLRIFLFVGAAFCGVGFAIYDARWPFNKSRPRNRDRDQDRDRNRSRDENY